MGRKLIDKVRKTENFNFFSKLIFFLLIVFVLDYSIGSVLRHYYFTQKYGEYYSRTYAIEKTDADVLILGSSKAAHQYHSEIIAKGLKLSCYNAGSGGSSIFYHYAIFKAVLKRHTPKIIILDITRAFIKHKDSYDRLSVLLPYYERHPELRSIIELRSPYEKIKLISKIYPYNSMLFSIIIGNIELDAKFKKKQNKDINGYIPLNGVWTNSIKIDSIPAGYELDSNQIKLFESMIKDCERINLKLYVVHSPDFIIKKVAEKSNLAGKEIAKKYHVELLDHYQDSLFLNNSKYFFDISHFNDEGAKVFSKIIVDKIIKDQSYSGTY